MICPRPRLVTPWEYPSRFFAVCFILFVLNIMGGGDAKLLTALALWFGLTPSLLVFLVNVAFAGGILTLLILAIRWKAHLVTERGMWLPASLTTAKKDTVWYSDRGRSHSD